MYSNRIIVFDECKTTHARVFRRLKMRFYEHGRAVIDRERYYPSVPAAIINANVPSVRAFRFRSAAADEISRKRTWWGWGGGAAVFRQIDRKPYVIYLGGGNTEIFTQQTGVSVILDFRF